MPNTRDELTRAFWKAAQYQASPDWADRIFDAQAKSGIEHLAAAWAELIATDDIAMRLFDAMFDPDSQLSPFAQMILADVLCRLAKRAGWFDSDDAATSAAVLVDWLVKAGCGRLLFDYVRDQAEFLEAVA